MFESLQTIQFVMRPVAVGGLCLHMYPHSDKPGTWVVTAASLGGVAFGHKEFADPRGVLAAAMPPEGGKFLEEQFPRESEEDYWQFTLKHGDDVVLQQEYPPGTNLRQALTGFFSTEVLTLLQGPISELLMGLMRMGQKQ